MSSEGRPAREVAYRVFAAEYDAATHSYKESDEERAPNYVVTPSGARVNRLFVVGVLTELERVGDDDVLRARVVDPTGAFVVYAGQYQPEALAVLEESEPPSFVAVTGKANTFTPEGSERTFSSIRPESVTEVDADTRDRWVVSAAEHTIDRIAVMADALKRGERGDALESALADEGVPPHLANGIPRAIEAYHTGTAYLGALRELSVDAARQVVGDIDEVPSFEVDPDAAGGTDVDLEADIGRTPRITQDSEGAEGDGTAGPPTEDTTRTSSVEPAETPPEPSKTEDTGGPEESTAGEETPETAESGQTPDSPSQSEAPGTTDERDVSETPGAASAGDEQLGEEELYELDEEEREAVESEFGVEFTSGTDIPDAGETEIEVPDPEAEPADEVPDDEESSASATRETEESSPTSDADLEDLVIEHMRDLGEGQAVQRSTLIEAVSSTENVDEDAVTEAIQDALMSGRCYESGEGELTPI